MPASPGMRMASPPESCVALELGLLERVRSKARRYRRTVTLAEKSQYIHL